jgi:murein L,D-transpeptidase YcbB/YkuD
MAVQTYENIQRLPPELEGLQKRLLQTGFGEFDGATQTTPGLLDSPLNLPDYQIAGMDPLRSAAIGLGEQMTGSYKPFMEGSANQALAAQQALTSGLGFLQPESISKFQNPYQDQVIDVAMNQLNRQADMRRAGADSAAIRSGAFGGSREGVQRAESERGLQQVKSDTLSKLLSSGFGQALKASQDAGRLSGGIGQAFGTLAGTTSDIGRLQQALGQADVSQLSQLGAMRQAQQQAGLDAQRQNQMQASQEPYTRLQLGQNLLQGMPSASIPSTFTQATTPSANPFLQGVGAYTTLSQIAPFGGGKSA